VLFVEAPRSRDDLAAIARGLGSVRPLLANMVEGGDTPILPAPELGRLGYSLVIFPGGIVRALARTAAAYYGSLKGAGTTEPFRDRMYDFAELNRVIGTPDLLEAGKRYEGREP
jgi:2-methylisocitrate lyase-like PEP mutase family enzyme